MEQALKKKVPVAAEDLAVAKAMKRVMIKPDLVQVWLLNVSQVEEKVKGKDFKAENRNKQF